MATKVTIDELTMPASAAAYNAAGQALAAGATVCTLSSLQTTPSIVLPSKANVLITIHGGASLGANTYYARLNIEVSSDNVTWAAPTASQYMNAGVPMSWAMVSESTSTSTAEFPGNLSSSGVLQLGAGTWYFRVTHSAALATGTISYGFRMCVVGMSWAA